MDEYDHPNHDADDAFGMTTVLAIFAAALSLFVCLVSLSDAVRVGPAVGEIISFDPRRGPRFWSQPGIAAMYAQSGFGQSKLAQSGYVQVGFSPAGSHAPRSCILMPSIMAASGGSFIVEAKETSLPPSFRVHWSGPHTDIGAGDCGRSADLILQLFQVRALATVAGGYGPDHAPGLF